MKALRKIRKISDVKRLIKYYFPVPFEELEDKTKEVGAKYLAFAVSAIFNAPINIVNLLIDELVLGNSFIIETESWLQAPGCVKEIGFLRHTESGSRFGSCILGVRYYK